MIYRLPKDTEMTLDLLSEFLLKHSQDCNNRMQSLYDAYTSNHEILHAPKKPKYKPDNRIVVNFPKYIVDTMNGFFIGNPIKTVADDEAVSDFVEYLDQYNDQDDNNAELSKMCSIFGNGYEMYYTDEESELCITYLSPLEAFMIYDESIVERPLFFVRRYTDNDKTEWGSISDSYGVRRFKNTGKIQWVEDDWQPHYFPGVPATEYLENAERQSIFEPVLSIVNAYNKAISEKANDVDYFADAYLKILGANVDDEDVRFIRDNRIVNFTGEDAEKVVAEFMDKPNSDTTQENLLERMERLIFQISMVANISDENFGNSSGIAMKYKLQAMSNLEKTKERKFTSGMNRRYKLLFGHPASKVPVDASKLPDNIKIGDRVNIVDDAGELYLSTRILLLERSEAEQTQKATLGEYLIKGSGISQKVIELAEQFAKQSQSAARALAIARNASTVAAAAKNQADSAVADAETAQSAADAATQAANTATQSAGAAQEAANNAQAAVDIVEESVSGLETTVANAQAAADQAKQAAETAETKATEAKTAASNALTAANNAETSAETAQTTANTAITNAATAQSTADTAKSQAETAATTAAAAKADAEQAQADIDAFGEDLTTLSNTMTADYARKTELTEAKTSLQTQITQNANTLSSHAQQITTIDETANNAKTTAESAQTTAAAAQTEANQAKLDTAAAQAAADNAAAAAATAQTEADNAKTAAATAQSVADKAKNDLEAAQADLATVTGRVDATEEEITAAQAAVTAAQSAADKAQADATAAATAAANAQTKADTASTIATTAQTAANNAASAAAAAQKVADEAKGDASAAQKTADDAATAAAEAQRTANTAVTNAAAAQTKANEAATAAATAQQAADDADLKAAQAAADLATAQQNLANVTSRVDATEEEVAAAQAAVETAQAAANTAKTEAEAAQATADTAKANAEAAQTEATKAKNAADAAQADATAAQQAADAAKQAVDALEVRVTTAETNITQNSEAIALRATKEEVTETLGGYYTKEETTAEALVTSEGVVLSALENYVASEDYNDFKSSTESELSVLSNEISIKFSAATEQTESVDNEFNTLKETINKHFSFSKNGITITAGENTMNLTIDNDMIVFTKNGVQFGYWDGVNFHTGNIIVDVNERAQFGNFAFIPRSNGSIDFLKVGG